MNNNDNTIEETGFSRLLRILNYIFILIMAFSLAKLFLFNGHFTILIGFAFIIMICLLIFVGVQLPSRPAFAKSALALAGLYGVVLLTIHFFMSNVSFADNDLLWYNIIFYDSFALFFVTVLGFFFVFNNKELKERKVKKSKVEKERKQKKVKSNRFVNDKNDAQTETQPVRNPQVIDSHDYHEQPSSNVEVEKDPFENTNYEQNNDEEHLI